MRNNARRLSTTRYNTLLCVLIRSYRSPRYPRVSGKPKHLQSFVSLVLGFFYTGILYVLRKIRVKYSSRGRRTLPLVQYINEGFVSDRRSIIRKIKNPTFTTYKFTRVGQVTYYNQQHPPNSALAS